MNCQECEATFSDLFDGESRVAGETFDGETRVAGKTRGREAARARAHLAVCPRCGEGYRAFEEAMGALRREPLEGVRDSRPASLPGPSGEPGRGPP